MAVGPSWIRERRWRGPIALRRRAPTWWGNRRCHRSLKLGTKRGEIELAHRYPPRFLLLALFLSLSFSPLSLFRALSPLLSLPLSLSCLLHFLPKEERRTLWMRTSEEDGGRRERVRSSLWKIPRLVHLSFRRRKSEECG